MATLKRWLIWTLHLFHDRELRKWLRDFYAQNCTHHPKTCFEFEIISLHKFCVTTCVFFKSISAKRWRWCAFLQFIFRLHSSFSDNQCCQLNLKLIWGNLKNCKSLEHIVWKFSNFPAPLILREIIFGWFQKVKNCHFDRFEGYHYWFFLGISYISHQKFPKYSKFRYTKLVKKAVFGLWNSVQTDFT